MACTQTWYVFLVMADTLTNSEIAGRLKEIRTLMEFAGEPFFKFMAYERAAETIENAAPLSEMLAGGRLQELPGVGKTIAGRIAELCETGTCGYLEELRTRYPSTLLEVLGVGGVGIKTARLMFDLLGIASLADLERALAAGTLSEIPRLGKKSIENIQRGVLAYQGRSKRTPIGIAMPLAQEDRRFPRGIDTRPRPHPGFYSLRRNEPTVGDVDIVCTSAEPDGVIAAFTSWERAEAVLAEGGTKASIWLAGMGCQMRHSACCPPTCTRNLLQHFTGSREHNIQFRELAVRKGLRVSENGIVDLNDGRTIVCRTEAEVYATLGLMEIPPEMRLGLGEIEAARDGTRCRRSSRSPTCGATFTCTRRGATATTRSKRWSPPPPPAATSTTRSPIIRSAAVTDWTRRHCARSGPRRARSASATISGRCVRPKWTSSPTERSTTIIACFPS